jgi:hypothetical protein
MIAQDQSTAPGEKMLDEAMASPYNCPAVSLAINWRPCMHPPRIKMIISQANAFSINRLAGAFFPLSVKVTQKENVTGMSLCAQAVVDVCDLIEQAAQDSIVVFGVGQVSNLDERTDLPISLAELAENAHVPFTMVDAGTIVLPKGSLFALLSTFCHYDLSLFDIGKDWREIDIISQVIAHREHDWRGQAPLLARLPASKFFLDCHDDCYLSLETCNPQAPKYFFMRTLQIFTGTILWEKHKTAFDVVDFPLALLNSFWGPEPALTILEQTIQLASDYARLGVSRKHFSFSEDAEYKPEFWIRYGFKNREWSVEL